MARKIFVTYKHNDYAVEPINSRTRASARDYVNELIGLFEDNEIYKGEGNEDLSRFKDDTIASHLKDRIYDSSITLVLISLGMKDLNKKESDQWIPWEISYSLKEITRDERTSHPNAVLAIILPDQNGSYSYFLEENICPSCDCTIPHTNTLFEILKNNMFNLKKPVFKNCQCPVPKTVYDGHPSYIHSVKWCDFINNKEKYLETAENIREKRNEYDITKTVNK